MDKKKLYERYQRQIILPGFGEIGQHKLLQAKVLVIGAGGLGCPILQYLTAAGIGTIGIIDDDVVSLNNLHRQVLYSAKDVGFSKVESAAKVLRQLNPEIEIMPYNKRLTNQNALSIIEKYEIIIDGTDNFSTRYMINDACVLMNKPLVYGAIFQFEGQVSIFNFRKNEKDKAINYRDIFPDPPQENEILNCSEAGVLGVLPGIIGTMMANETLKLITGIGEPLSNELLIFNALNNGVFKLALAPGKKTHSLIPKNETAFLQMDYEMICSTQISQPEIDVDTFNKLIVKRNLEVIDVREPGEMPLANSFSNIKIPLSQLKDNIGLIKSDTIVTFCQTGQRSLQAAKILSGIFGKSKTIYSLRGGLSGLKKHTQRI